MAFGFSATNSSNQFLVTDEFDNYHFLGKATEDAPSKVIEDGTFRTGDLNPSCDPDDFGPNGTTGVTITKHGYSPTVRIDRFTFFVSRVNVGVEIDLGCSAAISSITFDRGADAARIRNADSEGYIANYALSEEVDVRFADTAGSFSFNNGGTHIEFPAGNVTGGILDHTETLSDVDITAFIYIANTSSSCRKSGSYTGFSTCNATNGFYNSNQVTIPITTTGAHRYWAFDNRMLGGPSMTVTNITFRSTDPSVNPPVMNPRVIHTHTLTSTETPLVFIKPADYTRFHSVISQSNVGNAWTFQTLVTGDDTPAAPELFCFVPAKGITTPTDTHGMKVQKANGDATFDSRLKPLAIVDGGSSQPPAQPSNISTETTGAPLDYAWENNGTIINADAYAGDTTLTLYDTSSLPSSGTANLNGYARRVCHTTDLGSTFTDVISWTGKTATTLTGVTGITSNHHPTNVNTYNDIGGITAYNCNVTGPTVPDNARSYVTPNRNAETPPTDYSTGNSETYTASTLTTAVAESNLMFSAPSIAQAVYSGFTQSFFNDIRINSDSDGSIAFIAENREYISYLRWVLYRQAFRLTGGEFQNGWAPWLSGLLSIESEQTIAWRGENATQVATVGEAPYLDSTINVESNAFLIADASKYN